MRKILSLFAAMLIAFAANATTWEITPTHCHEGDRTDGYTLYVTLARGAQAGDTIVLADGTYQEGQSIPVNAPVVIMAAKDAKPVVVMNGYFQVYASMDVQGIKFQCKEGGQGYCFYFYENSAKYLKLDNCEFVDFTQYCVSSWEAYHIDSCIVNNCYFHDLAKAPIYFAASSLAGNVNACDKLKVTNSTFANIALNGVAVLDIRNNGSSTAATSQLRVDHCTFYNCKGYERMIQSYKSPDAEICNCIMMNPLDADTVSPVYATYLYGGSIHHNLNYQTKRQYGSGVTVTDSIQRDPLFVDAANGDYTLGEGSPALAAGTEGSNLGDPRWWPAAPVPPTPQPAEVSWDWSKASYSSASESSVVWSGDDVTLTLAKANSQTAANNYLGGTNGHTRVYASQTLTFAPAEGVTIESIEITATSNDYAGKFKNSTWTNASATTSGSIVTVTPTYGASAVVCTITAATRATEVKVTYVKGEAPAVAKPAIAGETSFYDETEVTITCDTEGAAIYYTLDGTEPTAASTQYTAAFNLTASATVKAIAILGDDASAVVEAQFTKNPSFASFEALIAAGVADKTLVEVSFADIVIDSIYVNSSNLRKGIYFTVGETVYEIYYSNGDVVIPEEWVAGGKVSGTIRGQWTVYKGLWELVPTAPWTWAALTYAAPTPVVPVQYCAFATGHQNDPEFADPNGRILLTIKKGEGNNIIVAIKNNNEAGNTKTGLNFLWVNAQGATAVARYGDGTHDEADVEEVSVVVEFNEAKETYNFINIHWAYSGWTGEWAIDGLDVAASELCPGTDPVVGATNYYLVGSMNNWTPGLTDVFGQNPGSEGEYMAKATLAVGDEFKVMGITSGVLNPDTTWYPDLAPNYVVDVDHAGAAKNIYFRPDGQGGEGWHHGVIFVEPNQDALKAVSDSTTWNFSKLTQNTESSLYSSSKEGILLSASTNPSITDEIIYAGYDSLWTIAADFDGEAIAFTGEYPIRKNQYCMNGKLRIKTTVAGNIYVKFSDTGTSASDNPTRRYLMVNGDSTEYWTSRPKKNDDTYESRLNVETGAIHVPAGDVIITGSQAICVYYVTFVPDAAPTVNYYVAGSMNGWKADENYMLTPNNESLYEGEFSFAANDAFKVIGYDGSNTTWYPEGTGNDYTITEAGDYKITFNPAGNVEGWYAGFFNVVKKETPAEGPDAAPAEPTLPANQVKAVYSAKYEADCDFDAWGSGTVYTQEEFGKKFVTTSGWFGLVNFALNCSNMEKLHVDIWSESDATINIFPVYGGAGLVTDDTHKHPLVLQADQWNSFDLDLATDFAGLDLSSIFQIGFNEAPNMTFWVNNLYFYTTVATVDTLAPTDFTAVVASELYYSVKIKASAVDSTDVVKYSVVNGELAIASASGTSGADTYIVVHNLAPDTEYTLKVIAKDESGNEAAPIEVTAKTLALPEAAPVPTLDAEKVKSLYSDAYEPATVFETYNQNWWMAPAMAEGEMAANDKALFYYEFSAGSAFGWAFSSLDATGYQKLHISVYPVAAAELELWPVIQPEADYHISTGTLTANEWNEVILDYTDKAFAPISQLGWKMNTTFDGFFVDNVYFFNDAEGIENTEVNAPAVKRLVNGMLIIEKNGKKYTITGAVIK